MISMSNGNIKRKMLVIDGAMVSRSPHVAVYLDILDEFGIAYDVIGWNRKGDDISDLPEYFLIYDHITDDHYSPLRKVIEIFNFYRFAKNIINRSSYDGIVIFEIANSLFFYQLLKKQFKGKYIFDIRDYSPFCKLKIANFFLDKLIHNSYRTVISSKGFTAWLPSEYEYVISHNISPAMLQNYKNFEFRQFHEPVKLLTIGNLRDPDTNIAFLCGFGNNKNYAMSFVGDGYAQPLIKKISDEQHISNVTYFGHYEKKDEVEFYKQSDMINCCMDDNLTSKYLMSNRIYLAALFRKPIICIEGSYQSDIVRKYQLGIVVQNIENIEVEVRDYINTFSLMDFVMGCEKFLNVVGSEQKKYVSELKAFTETIYDAIN